MDSEPNAESGTPPRTPSAGEATPNNDPQDESTDTSGTASPESHPGLSAGALSALDKKTSTNTRHIKEIGIFTAQRNFQEMFNCLDQNYRREFLRWIAEEYDSRRSSFLNYTLGMEGQASVDSFGGVDGTSADRTLLTIAAELRAQLPTEAMAPGEKVVFPTHGSNADCSPERTLHVDSFLYTDEDVDCMAETGRLARHYCKECKSHNVESIIYVSHSASISQLRHVFSNLLPSLSGKTLVDVGSRLGNFLYGGFLLSEASELVGVEIDKYFCELSQSMLERHRMSSRCKVINSDIRDQSELLGRADVIVLNNVFEFFLPAEEQIKMWQFLHKSVRRPGCYLVTVPSLAKTFTTLGIKDIDLASWVVPADPRGLGSIANPQLLDDGDDEDDSELGAFHIYSTL